MALGKYSRIDGRKSSSGYCSTVAIVVFVALCFVGLWMMTSSSVAPVQNTDVSQENKNEVKTNGIESNVDNSGDSSNSDIDSSSSAGNDIVLNDEGKSKQFEDNPGDLPEDATKGDANGNSNHEENNSKPEDTENAIEEKQEDKSEEKSGNKKEDGVEENKEDKQEDKSEEKPGDKKEDGVEENKEDRQEDKSEEKSGNKKEDGVEENKEDKQEDKSEEKSGDKKEDGVEENKEDRQEDKSEEKSAAKKEDGVEENKEDLSKNESHNGDEIQENRESQMENKDFEAGETSANNSDDIEKKSEENSGENKDVEKGENQLEEKVEKKDESDQNSVEKLDKSSEVFPSGAQSELMNESTTQNGAFSTQATESKNEKETQKSSESENQNGYSWKLCNTTAGPDYIPCLDNWAAIRKLPSTKHYEHRERQCPDNPPTCLVPLPEGYQHPIEWPTSREKIWYHNVPHTKLVEIKGHQNWVKVSGEYLTFPGGGTQFKHGALHYIDFIQQSVPEIAWGKRSRVVLDVGCGVASFGGFLFDRDVLTMSLAPKDEHEAQVQFALERGIPAISAVMGTKRILYPGRVFDVVHCARCRVPWHIEGGKLLLELNRVLRPGGFFVWSATPIYQKLPEDVEIWGAMKKLTKSMCWEVVSITKDKVNGVGIAVYRKPTSNECYEQRSQNDPPLCSDSDDPNAAWNVPLQACMHKVPVASSERGSQWPEQWPARVEKFPYWLSSSQVGVYGKPAPEDFAADYEHWKRVVSKSYLNGLGINWSAVRNVMDMRAVYGGFAAALREMNLWVMNIVSVDAPDTLPIIYERGLFGIYHDWCESFSTYPRSYDLLHADHLFSKIKKKCNFMALVSEVDRILRPEGKIIVRDTVEIITELENIFKSMQWDIRMTYSKDTEGFLCAQKTMWRPKEEETITYAIS